MGEIYIPSEPKKKKVKCVNCGREMEAPREENPPYYCWKCEDKFFGG